jgi:pimeloyl-ACP methyl ester carboxylesterase
MKQSLVVLALVLAASARAAGPGDNLPDKVRRIPPRGVAVPPADRAELEARTNELGAAVAGLQAAFRNKPALLDLLPDVQVFHNAARYALAHDEFFDKMEVAVARKLLTVGMERAAQLKDGQAPWLGATGLVVRGYKSRIDDSVQPYGLVVPASFHPNTPHRHRLDLWFHGRGEKLSELSFLQQRLTSPGEFTPANAFVLHPYGRYCNANKFAGEIDTLEALEHARRHYPIDDDRVVVRGFSMGGAACWQFAVHYADRWAAAAPGAGFAETADFLKVFQNEPVKPAWYEQKLWHWYDCTDWAANLFHVPTVAYSGEKDRQKQAADVMAAALEKEGTHLVHVLGPGTGHAYHPQAKAEINRRIDAIADRGRDPLPHQVRFTTWTLRYPRLHWVRVDGLEEHWRRARVAADVQPGVPLYAGSHSVRVITENVTALTLDMPPGLCPLNGRRQPTVVLDDAELAAPPVKSDRSWTAHFRKTEGKWRVVPSHDDGTLRKRPGLQGPIDDAFMDRFLMVRPTGKALHDKTGSWVAAEMAHAVEHWRRQFRGEARVKDDVAVTLDDIADSNLVLWGDPGSNQILAKIADKLPIRWDGQAVVVGDKTYSGDHHIPVLIYPNPLNPKRYVVLNSGFTFREYDYLNNARQVPKLPDWAVLDVAVPRTSRLPAGVAAAGFFDESWRLPTPR